MLPFDNKSELQVVIDMPEGTSLEETAAADAGDQRVPEDRAGGARISRFYVGTSAPFQLQRSGASLLPEIREQPGRHPGEFRRRRTSGRPRATTSPRESGRGSRRSATDGTPGSRSWRYRPGPPVLSTLVAEVYGPDLDRQIEIAATGQGDIHRRPKDVVDVDWYVEADHKKYVFDVDKEKAALNGIDTETVSRRLRTVLNGTVAGLAHLAKEREPVELLRVGAPCRPGGHRAACGRLRSSRPSGQPVSLAELVKVQEVNEDKTIYRKNLKRVVYVIGDVAGKEESPVYPILKMMGDRSRSSSCPKATS